MSVGVSLVTGLHNNPCVILYHIFFFQLTLIELQWKETQI